MPPIRESRGRDIPPVANSRRQIPRAAIGKTRNTWAGGTQVLKGGHRPTEGGQSSGREDDAKDQDSV
ncbi:unnamed protein product, partial [Gadus morhua 'NCC']